MSGGAAWTDACAQARPARTHGGRLLLIVLAAAIAIAACGVQPQSSPHRIAADDVPFGLAESTTTTSVAPGTRSPAFPVYFGAGGRLVGVWRTVPAPLTLRSVLRALVAGPAASEAAFGLRSAIPPDTRVLSADVNGPVAEVDLDVTFLTTGPTNQVAALAEFVFTASAFDGVKAVRFLVDGQRVDVPRGDGTLASGPVTPADYAVFAP